MKYPLIYKGKVRDVYDLDDNHLLIDCSDRISAFDIVFLNEVKGKGKILNDISSFWFQEIPTEIISNHFKKRTKNFSDFFDEEEKKKFEKTGMIVKKTRPISCEAIVRKYNFERHGSSVLVTDMKYPFFTASTKAPQGSHDENITKTQLKNMIGAELADQIEEKSLKLFHFAYEEFFKRGLILADTKLEFGLTDDGEMILIDEAFTPDSSRLFSLWKLILENIYSHYDKEIFRNWLRLNSNFIHLPIEVPSDISRLIINAYSFVNKTLFEE